MRAIVLVGGEGTRLRPLTWRTPKPLVPVLNRPLLEYMLRQLASHGVTSVRLAMTARSARVEQAFGTGAELSLDLDYVYEDTPLGSGGAIAQAAAGWDEPFLVCNGDIVTDLDISAMIESHRARDGVLSIALHEVEDPSPFGVVALGEQDRITRFVEKPSREEAPSRLINAGVWLFEPALLREMDATAFNRVEDGLFPTLAAAGRRILGFHQPGAYWIDVGNPRSYLRVNVDLLARMGGSRTACAEGASIAPSARVTTAALGAGTAVEAGAQVADSVLWDGVRVGAGATVRRSVLASGVVVGARATVEDAVVAHGARIAEGARLAGGAVLEPDARYPEDAAA
jgi:mannose-1-phosphate guanylyltransferase